MLDPDIYLEFNKAKLLVRLVEIETSLGELYISHHESIVAEQRQRQHSFSSHLMESEAAKKRIADQETFALWEEAGRLASEILIHEEERDMLKYLIGHIDGNH